MPLTREQIVRTAIDLLDEVGLEGLTLRGLAKQLGVSAPTLYWHVQHKRALLDHMAEAMLAQASERRGSPAPGEPWWDWLVAQSRLQWQALLAHRDGALVVAGNRPTDASVRLIEETLGTLVTVGFPADEALESLLALGNYVIGSAVEHHAEVARAQQTAGEAAPSGATLDGEELPYLAAAVATHGAPQPNRTFEHGLGLLVSGMRGRLVELTGTGDPLPTPAAIR
ncbi:MAG: TetR/AcrR family transcriptional regulator C-terminal domain-containing protein [Frankiaceae bacterium]